MQSYLEIAKQALQQLRARPQRGETGGTNNELNETNEVITTPALVSPTDGGPHADYRHAYTGDKAGTSELQEIARRVEDEGFVLLWADVLQDFVAFYKTEADRLRIPAGFVPYSDSELQDLFREDSPGWSMEGLRRIHTAKKIAGLKVTEVHDDQ